MTSIEIVPVRLSHKADIIKLVKKHKLPLDRIAIADKASGYLYIAEGSDLFAVHDPWSGDLVVVDHEIQTYIGPVENAALTFHTVFMDESGSVCTETGMPCNTEPVSLSSWTSAILEAIFLDK